MTDRNRTAVILSYRKKRRNYRLLFGRPEAEIRRGWHRKLAIFPPEKLLGYERWEANSYGTQHWMISVCRTVSGGSITQIPGIQPGAKLLLRVQGTTKSKRFLECLDGLKGQNIDPETVPDRDWMELNLALEMGAKGDALAAIIEARASC
jgi:hypothetical protein